MDEHRGWLLDVYEDEQDGLVLWLLGEDDKRYRFTQRFPITFFVAGPFPRLRQLWRYLKTQPIPVKLDRTQREDLFTGMLDVLAVEVLNPFYQPRLFHQVIRKWGLPTALYLDRGPGFIADDTHRVAARLGIRIILGTAGYAEGHGKIEKYHQILISRWIRGLDGDPAVDPSCEALTLRLRHWLGTGYNHRPHEGIDNDTTHERWHQDSHALQVPDPAALRAPSS